MATEDSDIESKMSVTWKIEYKWAETVLPKGK